jgi:hypothetical protein
VNRAPFFAILLASGLAAAAQAQSITLSPAVVPLRGSLGQSISQALTLENSTDQDLTFTLEARDVVIRDGVRVFVTAGELAGSIAATAVFTPREVRIPGRRKGTVRVTLTLPPGTTHRAVVALFRATSPIASGKRHAYLSLGTLFTFTLSDHLSLAATALQATPPSASANARLASTLTNDGAEPIEPRGMAVILASGGAIVGKVPFPAHRLLPGERTTLTAEYAGE